MNIEKVLKWEAQYDYSKYPYKIYEELVIKGKEHPLKFAFMGAWKTECLTIEASNPQYYDNENVGYRFSERWKDSTSVGFQTWNSITINQSVLKEKVPTSFPEYEPKIIQDLKSSNDFNFVRSIFTLHCWYPHIYPLYNEHIYRAFKYLTTGNREAPLEVFNNWQSYIEYRSYFIEKTHILKINSWKLDRALWAFGENLKTKRSTKTKLSNINSETFVSSNTLGAKENPFEWCLTKNNTLIISRKFKSGVHKTEITFEELNKIEDYMNANNWVKLANNVDKLHKKTENEGLGWFFYNKLDKGTTDSQATSHLAAIFTKAEIWISNERKTKMEFKRVSNDWHFKLSKFYEEQKQIQFQ